MLGISRFTWNANNDQLLAWVPLLLHTQRGKLKKDWPAEAICNGCLAESCSEARYMGDAAQEPILAKSRILFRIFFTPRKLNHGNLKFGKNTHMEVTNIKNPLVCLQNYLLFQASSFPSVACSNCGARIASQLPGLFILFLLGRLSLLPRITLSSSESSERQENHAWSVGWWNSKRVFLPYLFLCYLQLLGAGTFHFACHLQQFGSGTFPFACYAQQARTFHFAYYLQHFIVRTFVFACYL